MLLPLFFIYISCLDKVPVEDISDNKDMIEPVDTEPSYDEIELEPSGESTTDSGIPIDTNDVDGDGYGLEVDCDDQNPNIHPDAEEICDSIDNNCDGFIDPEELCGPAKIVVLDGYDGTIYTSQDSGVNWEITGIVPFTTPAKVAFAQKSDGSFLATTQSGELWASNDGGSNWIELPDAPWATDANGGNSSHIAMDGFGKYIYVTSTHSTRDGILYRSDTGGDSWEVAGTWPFQTGMDTDIAAVPYGPVYIVHTPYQGGQVFRSDNSGESFNLVGNYSSESGGNAIVEVDIAGTVYTSGNPETTFFASDDMGLHWSPRGDWIDGRSIASIVDYHTTLYAVSVKGVVLRSTDFGYTWQEVGNWGSAAQRDILSATGWIDVIGVY